MGLGGCLASDDDDEPEPCDNNSESTTIELLSDCEYLSDCESTEYETDCESTEYDTESETDDEDASTSEFFCSGCLNDEGNQEAHMGPGGCLASDNEDYDDEEEDDDLFEHLFPKRKREDITEYGPPSKRRKLN